MGAPPAGGGRLGEHLRRAVDVAFNRDHFFPLYGDPDGVHYGCGTMLGAWAEQTSGTETGGLVTCSPYRNAGLLARKARILAEHCVAVGRSPDTIMRSAGVQGGSLDALLAEADTLADLGVTLLTVGATGPDYDLTDATALCRWRDRRAAGAD